MSDSLKATVREIQKQDIELIADYWLTSDPDFMKNMGVDLNKIPSRAKLSEMLTSQLNCTYKEKSSYALIWELNGKAVGHCNVNNICFGEEAQMHLHLWQSVNRQKGIGTTLVKKSLPYFFENLKLKKLVCEPYTLNPAPNRTLAKVGFQFTKAYTTVPGSINFEQEVNRWELEIN